MIIVLLFVLYIVSGIISEALKDYGYGGWAVVVDVIACIIALALIS